MVTVRVGLVLVVFLHGAVSRHRLIYLPAGGGQLVLKTTQQVIRFLDITATARYDRPGTTELVCRLS